MITSMSLDSFRISNENPSVEKSHNSKKRKRSEADDTQIENLSIGSENISKVQKHVLKIIKNTIWPIVSLEQVGAEVGLAQSIVSKAWKAMNNGQIPIKYWKWFFVQYDPTFLSKISNVYNLQILGDQTYEQFIKSLWLKVREVIKEVTSNEFVPYTPSSHTIQTAETSLNIELTKKITSLFLEIMEIPSLESSQFDKKVTEWLDCFPEEKVDKSKITKKIFEMKEAVTLSQMQNDINLGSTQVISKIEDLLREFQVFDKQIDLKKTSKLIADVIYFRQRFSNSKEKVEQSFTRIARQRIIMRHKLWNEIQKTVAFLFNVGSSPISRDWTEALNYDPKKEGFDKKKMIKYHWAAPDKISVMRFLEKKYLPMYVMMEGKNPLDFMRDIQQLLDNFATTKFQNYINYLESCQRIDVFDVMPFSSHFENVETVPESVSTVENGVISVPMEVEYEDHSNKTTDSLPVILEETSESENEESDDLLTEGTSRPRKRTRTAEIEGDEMDEFLESVDAFIEAEKFRVETQQLRSKREISGPSS